MTQRYPTTIEGQRVEDARRIVSYASEPMGRAVGFVVILSVPTLFLLCLAIGIVWLTDMQAMWVLILFGAFGLLAFLALAPVYFKHTQEGIDLARVGADRDVDLARIDADRDVQMARAEGVLQATQVQMQQIALESERTLSRPAQSILNHAATFVSPVAPVGETDEIDERPMLTGVRPSYATEPLRHDLMVRVMLNWASEVHKSVGVDGRIASTLPWGKRGAMSDVDCERAQRWLWLATNAAGEWIVEYNKRKRGYYLNIKRFPNAAALLAALGAVVPPRFEPGGGG